MTLIVAAVRLPCPLGLEARLTPPPQPMSFLWPRKDVTVGSSWKRAWSPVPHLCEVLPEAVILRQRQVS
jgi:hypothetical protein